MCTVVFYPLSQTEFILSSNRDELPARETIPPETYINDEVELLFPKDKVAGGTWIGASSKHRVLTLMNGGFEPHKRKALYRLSRGVVVVNLLKANSIIEHLNSFDFEGIEPFTIVLFDYNPTPKLYQIVWDEVKIHLEELELKPRIWSSTPLYTREMHTQREKWFENFLKQNSTVTKENLWQFYHEAGKGNNEVGLIMDRGFICTKSITQMVINKKEINCAYKDLQTDSFKSERIKFED